MKYTLRGASGVAIAAGLAAFAMPAWAQQALEVVQTAGPQEGAAAPAGQVEQTPAAIAPAPLAPAERIVVTGSLVGGESEDAPSPVEVFDMEALQEQGAPTAAEFLRSLSIASEAAGEADSQIAGASAGLATVNLRGLGANRTMVLLNGRRFASSDTADINTLPMMAIGRVDVLKDGASVTYGAGAVGGVINYVTRKNFEGFEVNVEKRIYDGSDGEESIEALWGLDGDSSNVMVAASYGKRHELGQADRDFSTLPYAQQPAGWTTVATNPSVYRNSLYQQIHDYSQASCEAIGGELSGNLNPAISSFIANDCAVPLAPYFNLIDEEIYTRGYFEYNADFSDTMEFHAELAYAKTENPNIKTGASIPNGGKRAQEGIRSFQNLGWGLYRIPYSQATYSAAGVATGSTFLNPFAVDFYNRNPTSSTAALGTGIGAGAAAARTDLYTQYGYQWRPLMFGGHPLYEGNHRQEKQQRERFGGSLSLSGEFTEEGLIGRFLPAGTTFDYSATYNQYTNEATRPDWIVSRLQNALAGYGGPNCNAVDRVATDYTSATRFDQTVGIQSDTAPGTNGCEYFNPFSSSFAYSFVNGAANPEFNAGNPNAIRSGLTQSSYQNSAALLDWITHDRVLETANTALTFDATFTGELPWFELPGGTINWALGSQWRQTEERTLPLGDEDEVAIGQLECPWGNPGLATTAPSQQECNGDLGPFFGSGLGPLRATKFDQQTISFFGEVQIPVLDNLNFQLALRHEDFGTADGTIYKVAGKYDILPELSLRASYSTNFAAPPQDLDPSRVEQGGVYTGSLFRTIPTTVRTVSGITPEDDTALNLGVIYAPEVFGGDLRVSADFWEISVLGEIGTTPTTQALQGIFGTASPAASRAANCTSRYISLATFEGGVCNATTTAAQLLSLDQYTLNTGGYVTNGVDYAVDYRIPVGPGDLFTRLAATQVLVYKIKGYDIPGVLDNYLPSFDGLGSANLGRGGTIMPDWRGNLTVGYNLDAHRFVLRANYIAGFEDDLGNTTPTGIVNGVVTYPTYGMSGDSYADLDFNYIFEAPFDDGLQLRFSVLNLTDEDPMEAQHTNAGGPSDTRTGYYPGYGNPRGRTFELGVTKSF